MVTCNKSAFFRYWLAEHFLNSAMASDRTGRAASTSKSEQHIVHVHWAVQWNCTMPGHIPSFVRWLEFFLAMDRVACDSRKCAMPLSVAEPSSINNTTRMTLIRNLYSWSLRLKTMTSVCIKSPLWFPWTVFTELCYVSVHSGPWKPKHWINNGNHFDIVLMS